MNGRLTSNAGGSDDLQAPEKRRDVLGKETVGQTGAMYSAFLSGVWTHRSLVAKQRFVKSVVKVGLVRVEHSPGRLGRSSGFLSDWLERCSSGKVAAVRFTGPVFQREKLSA